MRNLMSRRFPRFLSRLGLALVLASAAPFLTPSAMAQTHGGGGGHGGGGHVGGGHVGGGHVGGGWHGGWHGGWGWGWGVGIGIGLWDPFFWGWPYYPWGWPYAYDYYGPAYYYAAPTVIETAPVAPGVGPSWYYCDNPQGYYPYVQSCVNPWRQVPATPPPPAR